MIDRNPARQRALNVIKRIEMMCDFIENPAISKTAIAEAVPVSMPPRVGSLGFDIPLWVGLGMVGFWAALDAFAERAILPNPKCVTCGRRCMPERFVAYTQGNEGQSLEEIEDIRHLYAHNFAGEADSDYFQNKRRHILKQGVTVPLTCGAQFDGQRLQLGLSHLRMYSGTVQKVLERVL
jgi:hypothetical protein